MIETEHFDAIVIGTGQAGPSLAHAFAAAGKRVAVIERKYVGGTCINAGCTPTKTMVASARIAHLARKGADYGVQTGSISIDLKKVKARKDEIVQNFRSGNEDRLESVENIELIFGHASFSGKRRVKVNLTSGGERELTADHVFINAGARARVPRIDGLDTVPWLNNVSIMELEEVPRHLVVLGGGYIGLEFGQMFRRFGSEVTIIQRHSHILNQEDEDLSEAIEEILKDEGIDLLTSATATSVRNNDNGDIIVTADKNGKEVTVTGSHFFVALGRVPNTDDLGCDAAGIDLDERGFIKVNDKLETSVEGVYALGDINGGPAFTHVAYDDYRVVAANLLGGDDKSRAGRLVPYCVYIDPQLGRVGLSEKEAKERGIEYRLAKLPNSHIARAIETGETAGFMKALVDPKSGEILGAAVLGTEGGEVVAVLQMAMMGGVHYSKIKNGVFAHPSFAESLNNLFMAMDRQ